MIFDADGEQTLSSIRYQVRYASGVFSTGKTSTWPYEREASNSVVPKIHSEAVFSILYARSLAFKAHRAIDGTQNSS